MNTFFDNIQQLDQFTLDLDVHRDEIMCPHCKTGKYLRSHGFVYKRCFYSKPWPSGKRLFCSNRQNNRGCGRTKQLYVQKAIPQKHHHTRHLVLFILQLLRGLSVDRAYFSIRQTGETRNGYRWVQQLKKQLTFWRALMQTAQILQPRHHSSPTVAAVLPTLIPFIQQKPIQFASHMQRQLQQAFISWTAPFTTPTTLLNIKHQE